eukprot:scaffold69154_cov50-Phaeocystis_antarctica.AAC.3
MFHRPRMTSLCSPSDGADTTWLGLRLRLRVGVRLRVGLEVLAAAHRVREVLVPGHLCLLLRAGGVQRIVPVQGEAHTCEQQTWIPQPRSASLGFEPAVAQQHGRSPAAAAVPRSLARTHRSPAAAAAARRSLAARSGRSPPVRRMAKVKVKLVRLARRLGRRLRLRLWLKLWVRDVARLYLCVVRRTRHRVIVLQRDGAARRAGWSRGQRRGRRRQRGEHACDSRHHRGA